ncbi:MAG: hypothetical protein C4520_17820 [Candidatus Abyssobacteria bacterium SURF_5]|uniref:Uncharacterized protein n=1 Tax=Abyssobacteria bacterium (strain SURF_5) TaxID=2093360 RepID=A0A3A4NIM9_ABYX5|nr:MAG: hypothetical protein C4520_17820 [Candidatus Abyssubacteria bacterium SURF_5]
MIQPRHRVLNRHCCTTGGDISKEFNEGGKDENGNETGSFQAFLFRSALLPTFIKPHNGMNFQAKKESAARGIDSCMLVSRA